MTGLSIDRWLDRRRIMSLDQARALNSGPLAELNEAWLEVVRHLRESIEAVREPTAEDRRLIDVMELAGAIGNAMFSTRYGVGTRLTRSGFQGYDTLHYHNAQHSLDIVTRLHRLYDHFGLERFPPERRVLLNLFAVFHDLRQQESGAPTRGVGLNEASTAEEAAEILKLALLEVGFDRARDAGLFERLIVDMALMIHGTTFNFVGRDETVVNPWTGAEESAAVPVGAYATLLISQLESAHPDWKSQARLARQAENILLAADVDTANVSDTFDHFAEQGVNLCREIEKRKGHFVLDPDAVYGFMTGGQEYYFHVAQRYNTELRTFPGRIWHSLLYSDMQPHANFEATAENADQAPQVQF